MFLYACCGPWSTLLCQPLDSIFARFATRSVGVGVALAFVIAPAEEVFWRGTVQGQLRERLGAWGSVVISALLCSLTLLIFGEGLLALAAVPTSLLWGALTEWRKNLWPAIACHAVWVLSIAVLFPPRS